MKNRRIGQIAWFFDHTMSQWVKLRGGFFIQIDINFVFLHRNPKHSGALLGSNSMRNTIAEATAWGRSHRLTSAFYMLELTLMPRKTR